MDLGIGDGIKFQVGGGGKTTDQLFALGVVGAVLCGVVLVVGILYFIRMEMIRMEMKREFSKLNDKVDSIAKTLKEVE